MALQTTGMADPETSPSHEAAESLLLLSSILEEEGTRGQHEGLGVCGLGERRFLKGLLHRRGAWALNRSGHGALLAPFSTSRGEQTRSVRARRARSPSAVSCDVVKCGDPLLLLAQRLAAR